MIRLDVKKFELGKANHIAKKNEKNKTLIIVGCIKSAENDIKC